MSVFLRRLGRALSRNHAQTSIDDIDPRLRGRTYAIPFEQVWQAARALAGGGLRRWRIIESDDYEGIIHAEARTLFLRFVDDVVITIRLDDDAQTRADMQSRSRKGRFDFGANARRIGKFFRSLDQKLKR
ncbi:MAG: DUF1499 domain-containing protein [Gemmatimonadota bacterium]